MSEEYFCSNCENVFTSTTGDDSSPCPECGSEAVKIGGPKDKVVHNERYSDSDLDETEEVRVGPAQAYDDEISNFDDLETELLNFNELDGEGLPQSV